MDQVEQREGPVIRHVVATQFDARFFAGKFRMRRRHFAIEEKGNISVKFFLELMQPFIRVIPRSRFVHRKEDFIGLPVERKEIDDGWVGNPSRRGFLRVITTAHYDEGPTSNPPSQAYGGRPFNARNLDTGRKCHTLR